jgi:hypothetical protein
LVPVDAYLEVEVQEVPPSVGRLATMSTLL